MGLDLGGLLGGLLGGGGGGGGGGGLLGGLAGLDPLDQLVSSGCQMLGLPPVLTDAVKAVGGFCTGDFVMAFDGANSFLGDLSKQGQGGASCTSPCQTQYEPSDDEGSACSGYAGGSSCGTSSPVSASGSCPDGSEISGPSGPSYQQQELKAFTALQSHFEQAESEGSLFHTKDGKMSFGDVVKAAHDPSASPELRHAAGWVLRHPQSFRDMTHGSPFATQGSLEHAINRLNRGGAGGNGWNDSVGGLPPAPPPPGGAVGGCGSSSGSSGVGGCDDGSQSGATDACGGSDDISSIINSNMDIEQKIEMVLQKMQDRIDGELQQNLQDQNQVDQQNAANKQNGTSATTDTGTAKSSSGATAKDLQFQMQQLADRKKQISDTLTTIAANFNDMKKLEIQNMGRA